MKTLIALASLLPTLALAAPIDYVSYSLNLPAVKALQTAFPVCKEPTDSSTVEDGITHFMVTLDCKTSKDVDDNAVNQSATITITGESAPWGEIGNAVVKVGSFCQGNCEI